MPRILPFTRPRRWRFLSSRTLLALFIVGSVAQYLVQGNVTWVTASLRWADQMVSQQVASVRLPTGTDSPVQSVEATLELALASARNGLSALQASTTAIADTALDKPVHSASDYDLSGTVVRIADGDTLTLLDATNTQHKIRLHGIDTPERRQPYGNAAREALEALVAGQHIGVVVQDTDRYGRTVGTVYRNGLNVNLTLVEKGWAWWYERYARNDRELAQAQREARAARRGLWQDSHPIAPWEWRRLH
ncbi:thermonuclease family protein [Haliea sp.]|jgi:endonuclease YncB( thermonuclease family)|uniref:thermonuclease family protein n=1 Tax=Haliea sp. TaxID=1932666 RepID=UPI0025803131|nr:thermonuclease family protein [Haliea sp.]|tara:strand:- start:9335 stop:10081 length:747 start_codon:yes stop_codon:yes gene_type:complete